MIGHRQLTLEEYLLMLRRHKVTLIACVVLGPIAAYLLCFLLPKEYTSQTTILVQQPAISDTALTEISSADLKQKLTSLQEQILSQESVEGAIDKFGLYAADRKNVPMESLMDRFKAKVKILPVKPMAESNSTQLPGFTINVANRDPVLAQKLCSEITARFLADNQRVRHDQAQATTDFLTQQIEDAKAQADERDAKLAAFKQRYLGELPDDQQANLSILSGLNTQLEAATQELTRAQQDKAFAESRLSEEIAAHNGNGPVSLEKQLSDQEGQLAELQTRYTADHPDVIKLKASIADLKAKIAAAGQNPASTQAQISGNTPSSPEIDQFRAQVHQYDSLIKARTAQQREVQRKISMYEGRVQLSPAVEEQYKQLTRDHQAAVDFYNTLLKKRSESAMESEINHQKEAGEFRVLNAASLPAGPSFPNRLYFMLGGLGVGLVLGVGVTVLGEVRDKTLRTEQDVEFFLQLPTLANIPSVASAQRNAARAAKEGPRLVANG